MMTKTATELKAIHNNPPTREEFEAYKRVSLYFELEDIETALLNKRDQIIDDLTDDELELVVDRYEDEIECNSSPMGILSNVFESVLED